MPLSIVLLLSFAVLASAFLLIFSFQLRLRHGSGYLTDYFYFILVVVGYGLINWVAPSLIIHFQPLISPSAESQAILLITAGALPLVLLKLLMLVRLLLAILQRCLPPSGTVIWLTALLAAMASLMWLTGSDPGTEAVDRLIPFLFATGLMVLLLDYLAIGYFLSRVDQLTNQKERRCARYFGWSYLIGYFIYSAPYYLSNRMELPLYPSLAPYLYYLLHLIPLLITSRFGHFGPVAAAGGQQQAIAQLCRDHAISVREQAILTHLIAGNNNREIAAELFISPNTVRNHIYSIYKKMGVKNRLQLLSACRRESA